MSFVKVRTAWRDIRGAAGTMVDFANLARARFVHPHSYTKFLMLRAMARRTKALHLVEGGTFRAVNAARCARVFRKVYTVELDPELAAAARDGLARFPNCKVIEGDAGEEIPRIVASPEVERVIVLLDAHPCGIDTAEGEVADPAILALRGLSPFKDKLCGVIVDDFRLFGKQHGFPQKWELVREAEENFGGFSVAVSFDQLVIERSDAPHER